MAAGNEEQQIWKFDAVGQACGERVTFQMIDCKERLAGCESQCLRSGQPDDHSPDQPRSGGR